MQSRMNAVFVVALATVAALVGAAVRGGTMTGPIGFTNDAGSGISSLKTYTAAIDPGLSTNPAAVVNGVTFTRVAGTGKETTLTAPNFTYQTDMLTGFAFNSASGTWGVGVPTTEGVYNLLTDMVYGHGNHNYFLATLSGLTAGNTYDLRLYYHQWSPGDTRNATITFDEDGAGPLGSSIFVNEDAGDGSSAFYLSYKYVAASDTATCNIVPQDPGAGWHMYGLSNELVAVGVPEPGTLAVLAAGLVGLLLGTVKRSRPAAKKGRCHHELT